MGVGFLGKNIMREFQNKNYEVIGTTLSKNESNLLKIDITSKEQLGIIFKLKPQLVINCVAKTDIDYLEKNQDDAFAVNSFAIKNLADVCNKENIRLIHLSTDSVFDGRKGNYKEDDIPNPINVYAKSKLEGEKIIEKICKNYVIIRTNFYGIDGKQKFLFEKIYHQLSNSEEIIGFIDVIFSPLEVTNLSKMILDVSESDYVGRLHLSSDEFFSKYHFCKSIAKIFGFDENLIKKGSIDEFKFVAKRPKNTSLNNEEAKKIIKTKITKFEDWLTFLKKSKVEI